ncbi:hypothetical protein GLV81_01620 [Phnomibacter ginsenosidimutans]|uniref:Uncharacterized protein n=1 Tax=Phnomibacter ginsenosidimutans TaxID=2676868 RepID=A0A6I6GWD5_9BACT|nr:hypothetical protein GLV81_01620 [Phnomibacter ginsenosidimutans]
MQTANFAAQTAHMAKKANRAFFRFSIVVLLFIGVLLGLFVWQQFNKAWNSWQHEDDPDNTFTLYSNFGIWLPNQYSIHGIDVSRYQKRVNWSLVSKMKDNDVRLQFAFIKATEGADLLDEQFMRNWKRAREHRMIRGRIIFSEKALAAMSRPCITYNRWIYCPAIWPPCWM